MKRMMRTQNPFASLYLVASCMAVVLLFQRTSIPQTIYYKLRGTSNLEIGNHEEKLIAEIKEIMNKQKEYIQEEANLLYTSGKLSEWNYRTDKIPIQSLILTTWNSGSQFLRDFITSMPGAYYHHEPLQTIAQNIQIRGAPYDESAIEMLKQLFTCNYTNMENYLSYGKYNNSSIFNFNYRLRNQCQNIPQLCWESRFIQPFCKLFPLQVIKVVRLRLHLVEQILQDQKLKVNIIYLVRDPRGTLISRKNFMWCKNHHDCAHPLNLCSDLVSDYHAAINLKKKYPQRIKIIRFEDLALNPYRIADEILKFYDLPMNQNSENVLKFYMKNNHDVNLSSKFKDFKTTPFNWIRSILPRELKFIESSCTEAMSLWGYKKSVGRNVDNLFNPVLPFSSQNYVE